MHRAERIARHRLSPRRDRWAEVAEFDAKAGELEARQGELMTELLATRERLPGAGAEYEAALSAWHASGQKGARPESSVPALKQRLQALQDDIDAVDRLVEQTFERKAAFVRKHRRRLVQQATQATAQARATYEAAIDALEPMSLSRLRATPASGQSRARSSGAYPRATLGAERW